MERAEEKSDKRPSIEDCLGSSEIQELQQSFAAFLKAQHAEDQAWWDSLEYEQRAQAFRQICRLMHKSEVEDRGTYRWAIYDVFNLEYGDGLEHFMTLHNLIGQGLDCQGSK